MRINVNLKQFDQRQIFFFFYFFHNWQKPAVSISLSNCTLPSFKLLNVTRAFLWNKRSFTLLDQISLSISGNFSGVVARLFAYQNSKALSFLSLPLFSIELRTTFIDSRGMEKRKKKKKKRSE